MAESASSSQTVAEYDPTAQGSNGQTNPSHMPPPPCPPSAFPQNVSPIPTTVTSPLSGNMIPAGGGYVRRAAPEPNKRALYVGGLDPRVTEDVLKQIFETTGHVVGVKIIPDKNVRFHFPLPSLPPSPALLTPCPVQQQRIQLWLCRI